MKLRKATLNDLETLIQLRLTYLEADHGPLTAAEEAAIRAQLNRYISEQINHNFVAILAEVDDKVVSTASLAISEKPANPSFLNGKTGTLLNVYTDPPFRRMGIATQVIEAIIAEARLLGVARIDLLATPDGIALYKKLGFISAENKYLSMSRHLE